MNLIKIDHTNIDELYSELYSQGFEKVNFDKNHLSRLKVSDILTKNSEESEIIEYHFKIEELKSAILDKHLGDSITLTNIHLESTLGDFILIEAIRFNDRYIYYVKDEYESLENWDWSPKSSKKLLTQSEMESFILSINEGGHCIFHDFMVSGENFCKFYSDLYDLNDWWQNKINELDE